VLGPVSLPHYLVVVQAFLVLWFFVGMYFFFFFFFLFFFLRATSAFSRRMVSHFPLFSLACFTVVGRIRALHSRRLDGSFNRLGGAVALHSPSLLRFPVIGPPKVTCSLFYRRGLASPL